MIQKIPEIRNLPNGMVVEAVQVTVKDVYERKPYEGGKAPTTIQNCMLVDDTGNTIRAAVWGHPELAPLKGKQVILHSTQMGSKFGGVTVKLGTYQNKPTVELSVSKMGQFQHVEVYHQQAGTVADVAKPTEAQGQAAYREQTTSSRNGMQVGMAINNAVKIVVEGGLVGHMNDVHAELPNELARIASDILRVSDWLEKGHLVPNAKETAKESPPAQAPKPEPVAEAPYATYSAHAEQDGDVPF